MNRLLAPLCLILLFSSAGSSQGSRKEVIGYFPSWKWNSKSHLVAASKIPYDRLTIINYAFFVPLPDGRITGVDSTGDRMYLYGPHEWSLIGRAHRQGVRVLLSIGGWGGSEHFPAVAASPQLRTVFVRSCMGAIHEYGFDGIDLDWEYPGYAPHRGTPDDRENFTLLLSTLKDSLSALGARSGRTFLLTAALPAGGLHVRNIDVDRVAAILDQLNLMTYDFHGPWDPLAGHNAPLYPSEGTDPSRCVDAAVRLYRDTLGVPPSKVNIGVPFYGKAYAECTALNGSHAGADTVVFRGGGPFYYDIVPVLGEFTRQWDARAMVPYLLSTERKMLVSFDDGESVRAKGEYAVQQGLRGVIIWEITGDYLPDGTSPLLEALVGALEGARHIDR
jgi:chitinase